MVAETRASYLKDHAAMKEYLLNGSTDLKTVVRRIRPVMEGYLKSRFPNRFADNHWFGEMIGIIRTEGNDHPMFGAVDELGAINDYSKKHHHESNPTGYETEPVNDGELQSFVKRTLAIAGGY